MMKSRVQVPCNKLVIFLNNVFSCLSLLLIFTFYRFTLWNDEVLWKFSLSKCGLYLYKIAFLWMPGGMVGPGGTFVILAVGSGSPLLPSAGLDEKEVGGEMPRLLPSFWLVMIFSGVKECVYAFR